jgi:hypothetical protein
LLRSLEMISVVNQEVFAEWRGEYLNLSDRKYQEAGENCIMRGFITFTLHWWGKGDQIKERWGGRDMWKMRNSYRSFTGQLIGNKKTTIHLWCGLDSNSVHPLYESRVVDSFIDRSCQIEKSVAKKWIDDKAS